MTTAELETMVALMKSRTIVLACALLVGILGTCPETAYAARKAFRHFHDAARPIPRPPYTDYASMARWLTHMNDWGVIATTSAQTGLPWTNVSPSSLPSPPLLPSSPDGLSST